MRRIRLLLFIGMLMLFTYITMSCTSDITQEVPTDAGTEPFILELTDQGGKTVKINALPKRIISLAPSNTEIIYALGLQDYLLAVTEYCDYPPDASNKDIVGGFSTVDVEKVIELQPDLVIAANIHQDEITPQLEKLGITVITLDPQTVDEILDAITIIGKATGEEKVATNLVTDMRNRISAIREKAAQVPESQKPRVLYILWHDPLMTVGSTTRIHELIELAGGVNIARDLSDLYPTINLEFVVTVNPQVIIAGSGHGSSQDVPYTFVLTEERLSDVSAQVNGRIYGIDADLTSRPGPRVVEGLEQLAQFILPEVFGEGK